MQGDFVVAAALVDPDSMLLVAGDNGIGKRTGFDEYRVQSRGGKGIMTMKTTEKTGTVAGALTVRDADELMLITNKGKMVRTRVSEIRETGRNAQGVKLIDLRRGRDSPGHRSRRRAMSTTRKLSWNKTWVVPAGYF